MDTQNTYLEKLMSKNGISTMLFAQSLLSKEIGDRIETIEYYANEFDVGRGTIQFAMKFLSAENVVEFESRGHMGTYIKKMDSYKLLKIAGRQDITCSMPLPYSLRYEGLATGLYTVFSENNIRFNIAYLRGSKNRIQQLKDGKTDFIILSNMAALKAIEQDNELIVLNELSEHTYVGSRALVFNDAKHNEIKDGMRVAIDNSSYDQSYLTKRLCRGLDVEFIETSYNQISNMLSNNKIDVAVWNGDEIIEKNRPVHVVMLDKDLFNDTRSTILGLNENINTNKMITKIIDIKKIELIQQQVINREIIPTY